MLHIILNRRYLATDINKNLNSLTLFKKILGLLPFEDVNPKPI